MMTLSYKKSERHFIEILGIIGNKPSENFQGVLQIDGTRSSTLRAGVMLVH